MGTRALAATLVAAATVMSLAACTAPADPTTPEPEPTTTTAPTEESATPTAEPFALPDDCREMLPQGRMDAFEAQNMVLLGGPGGVYGEDYLLDPTPEEIAGGITCIWGDELVPQSTVTVSIAPITATTRSGIIEDLVAQGLVEAEVADGIAYSRVGDEVSSPAIVNVIRNNTWISVIEALGGEAFLEEAFVISDEIAETLHAD